MTKKIVLPTLIGSRPRKNFHRGGRKKSPTPVRLDAIHTPPAQPTLCFTRKYPKCTWIVPPLNVPVYWFDIVMVRKGLIRSVPPNHFICDGRRFKVLAQEQHTIGVGYTRWLVVEEHPMVPKV